MANASNVQNTCLSSTLWEVGVSSSITSALPCSTTNRVPPWIQGKLSVRLKNWPEKGNVYKMFTCVKDSQPFFHEIVVYRKFFYLSECSQLDYQKLSNVARTAETASCNMTCLNISWKNNFASALVCYAFSMAKLNMKCKPVFFILWRQRGLVVRVVDYFVIRRSRVQILLPACH